MIDASGIGVYLRECLPFLLNSEHTFLLIGESEKILPIISGRQNAACLECKVKPFSFSELLFFPSRIKKTINQTDLFYSPFFNIPSGLKIPVYITIHDIIFPDMPELTSKTGLVARMWFLRRSFTVSKKVFTVSDFSKSRIIHHLGNKNPVIVTYSAIQPYLLVKNSPHNSKKNCILFIGNIKKHKGLWRLLDAFFKARDEGLGYKLIIVGNKDNFRSSDTDSLKKLETADSDVVEFTGFVTNDNLKELLNEAALLVQPSLYEGFGLPPLEAMVCGTRALISDIPVFKEIYADFPVTFFHSGDSGDLKAKLMRLLYNKDPETLELSRPLLARYTFEKTASIILREFKPA
jgi:glycosyltransferase involved in cell wall biosynthesis